MRILVFSDSHGRTNPMIDAIAKFAPDAVIHCGDHYDDAMVLKECFERLPVYAVKGNCDYNCSAPEARPKRIEVLGGVRFLITHGHMERVKMGYQNLYYTAREAEVDIAAFGHTHEEYCQKKDGLWMLNPGAAGSYGYGSFGVIEVENGKILDCRIRYFCEE